MKRRKKLAIAAALVSIVLGLVLSTCALAAIDFDYARLNTLELETNTYDVTESFSSVWIDAAECDVRLAPSQDGTCRVVCTEGNKIFHTVAVENDQLKIIRTDERNWYEHIGVYWGEMSITVYLPETEYRYLHIKTLSGDITVPSDFTFGNQLQLHSTSGEIDCSASTDWLLMQTVSGDLRVQNQEFRALQLSTTSGELEIENVTTRATLQASSTSGHTRIASSLSHGGVSVNTVSGEVELVNLDAASLTANSSSGNVELSHVLVSGHMEIETVSGEIELDDCDGGTLWLKSTSGSVSGTLLTDKRFTYTTTSGVVRLPDKIEAPDAGDCEITTTSGDIRLSVTG